jgi:RHS repeat-associated protein
VRGDLSLTTAADGRQVGALRTYTPFGEPLTAAGTVDPDGVPDNQPGQMDYGWLGQHQRPYEHAGALSLVQMGARPYSPLLGRFLSVDPVDGGSANDYDYVNGDPVNMNDLDGRCPVCVGFLFIRFAAPHIARFVVKKAVPWLTRTAAPWVARNFVRYVAKPVGRLVRGVWNRITGTKAYIRKNPRKAFFRCAAFGGVSTVTADGKKKKAVAFALGCVANLIHDGWPTNK